MSQTALYQLINALQNQALFDHPVRCFDVIETHISCILLTGDYAYKFKKPVNLGFLDFSTLEQRRHYCNEELRLNSRLAPTIYLEVVCITGTEKLPEINGKGPVMEYAVKMRQFPQQALLINKAIHKSLTTNEIDQLASYIGRFHAEIKLSNPDTKFGTAGAVIKPVLENFQQINHYAAANDIKGLEQLKLWSEQEHQRLFSYFDNRKRDGFIRECHGDLHLGNIVLFNQQPTPFDGIEFNKNLYWIDIISEIAFLIMDLEVHQYQRFAFRFLNAWLELNGDYQGLSGLRFYLVYRALVRAKVGFIRFKQPDIGRQKAQCQQEVENYLQLARSYTFKPKPQLLICYGLSGSGKTTISQLLLEYTPGIRIRSDVERKRLQGLSPTTDSDSDINKGLYSEEMSSQTYLRLLELADMIIQSGYTVIVDAAFLKHRQRQLFQSLALGKDIPFHIIHCHAQFDTLRKRIIDRQKSGDDASEADLNVLNQQIDNRQLFTDDEKKCCIEINTESTVTIEQFNFLKHL